MSTTSTPRRSKRFQPLLSRRPDTSNSKAHYAFIGDPILSWRTRASDLLESHDRLNEAEDEEDEERETNFYGGFVRNLKEKNTKLTASDKEKEERFLQGDTVLVKTVARVPSVAVLVSMWQVHSSSSSSSEDEEVPEMRIKVHWFLRPTELPGVRAKRTHRPVRPSPPLPPSFPSLN